MARETKNRKKETRLRVTEEVELMQFLLQKMGGMSRTSTKSLLSHRQVLVNGSVQTRYNHMLNSGDEVVICSSSANHELVHPKVKVVYEDDDLLVVEKKAGLLTVPTTQNSRESTVFSILKNYIRKANVRKGVYVVHRLDRETSGLLVFAKTRELQEYMRDNWRQIVSNRTYVAVVEGSVVKQEDTVVSWLYEDARTTRVYSSFTDNGGKKSITHYKKLSQNSRFTLLELHLETGRTNQIRVQMAAIGHPVLGDRKYGSGPSQAIDRLALHAQSLSFEHPTMHKQMSFELPMPKEFAKLFRLEQQ